MSTHTPFKLAIAVGTISVMVLCAAIKPEPIIVDGVTKATPLQVKPVMFQVQKADLLAHYRDTPERLKHPPAVHAAFYERADNKKMLDRTALNKIGRHYGLPDDLLFYQNKMEASGRCIETPNRAGAVGCFQFIAPTAKEFGLIRDGQDFRAVHGASADAAARYIVWLNLLLYGEQADPSDWLQLRHVLAAYNAGYKRVQRHNGLRIPSFYETVRYVSMIEDLVKGRAVWVERGDTLNSLSERTGVPVLAILRGNPDVTGDHDLRADTVLSLPDDKGMTKVVVKRGMNLTQIAYRTGISIDEMVKVNDIQHANLINVGDVLNLPAMVTN